MSSSTAALSLWSAQEFAHVNFGDSRLKRRLIHICENRINRPCSSLPGCHADWADLKGTYRFMANDSVKPDEILGSHYRCTAERMKDEAVVLAIQDSCLLDYSNLEATTGLGPLQTPEHRGIMLHSVLAVRPDRLPLGLMWAKMWTRPQEEFGKRRQRHQRPFAEKESFKWVEALEACAQLQSELENTLVVHVADREADVYDFIGRSLELKQPILVRSAQDRCLDNDEQSQTKRLFNFMASQPVQSHFEIEVKRGVKRTADIARLSLRFCMVELAPPRSRLSQKLPSLPVWAVLAREEDETLQEGASAIEWLLLSTVPVNTVPEARRNVEWYACRWTIEMLHKVAKSGCAIEKRRFGDAERLQRYLALDLIVAWRVLYLTLAGRQTPDLPCSTVLEPSQWQALYCYVHRVRDAPEMPPTLGQAMNWIAGLGGFLGRKGDGYPGTQTMWKGMVRLLDIEQS